MRVAAAFCLLAVTLPAANSVSISDAASKAAEASLSKTETQASVRDRFGVRRPRDP